MDKKSRRDYLAEKYPEVEQHFQDIKQEINEPQIDHLGETTKKQKKNNAHWNPS